MNRGKGGIEPRTIQTIQACLEKQFVGVKVSQNLRPTFTFKDGGHKVSWLLVINEDFLADRMSLEEMRRFVEEKVIKKIHQSPGKRIQISKYRDITVEEKNLS